MPCYTLDTAFWFCWYRRFFFGMLSCTTPSRTTAHTCQINAFQDQRQIAQAHLDSGRRSRAVLLYRPRRLRYFKSSTFQSLVPNDEAVARKPQRLYAVTTSVEEEEQITRLY